MTPEEARRRVQSQRASFLDAVEAVQEKVGGEVEKVDLVVQQAETMGKEAHRMVAKYPWLFVMGALALGVAIGSRPARRRRGEPSSRASDGGLVGGMFDGVSSAVSHSIETVLISFLTDLKDRWMESLLSPKSPPTPTEPK